MHDQRRRRLLNFITMHGGVAATLDVEEITSSLRALTLNNDIRNTQTFIK